MPILLNSLFHEAGLPLSDLRLLRHADNAAAKGRTPYELWRDERSQFESYQSVQSFARRSSFGDAPYWASFASTPDGHTLFLGLYAVTFQGVLDVDLPKPHMEGFDMAGSVHRYALALTDHLIDLAGKLYVDWGAGTRTWVQRPDLQNKVIVELRRSQEDPPFPGYTEFIQQLSRIEALPRGWKDALRSSRGIYLLTCPRTKEQYVGKADGQNGFIGRWAEYASDGHGGNVGLKSRLNSDYQVSILEVAGSAATSDEIFRMEARWKAKLQSIEMGLNRN